MGICLLAQEAESLTVFPLFDCITDSTGPSFSTDDVIGCCVNFLSKTVFYTKNGVALGVASRTIPSNISLYACT